MEGLVLHVEVCEDMWVPVPPSAEAALAGATVLANLSGSPITVARAEDRRLLVRSASARCLAAYLYAAAGQGESTTDLSWDGQTMVYEVGDLLAETERFPDGPRASVADVDLGRIRQTRLGRSAPSTTTAARSPTAPAPSGPCRSSSAAPGGDTGLRRKVDRFPFVPDDPERLALDCYEAYNIQVSGLEQRLHAIGQPKVVIGVSGGLDSTHALVVAARAMDRLGRPRSDIHAFTLPGLRHRRDGPSATPPGWRARSGVTFEEIDITPAARQMLDDLDHPFSEGEPVYDVTFENVQAGLRTDYLFRLANHRGGIVLGTGDLSELALGLVHLRRRRPDVALQRQRRRPEDAGAAPDPLGGRQRRGRATTPARCSARSSRRRSRPELVPDHEGVKPQATEDSVGPYALQDFTLFHVLRHGFRPSKIAFLAWHAWHDAAEGDWPPGFPDDRRAEYDLATVRRWLEVFVRRFFANQFKRSALPNGPKVSAGGTMSPRGDWRMPSDASAAAWLAEIEANVPDE